MKNGEFPDGAKVLRAKIDMAHPNMLFRDPIMYRIIHATHHRTGDKWCIYPMYDYAHGQSDSIEHITHSICTLEFDVHRPLYDWFIQALGIYPSHQYEFARLNLTYTMMSKRKLLKLVQEGAVMGWDDPRMPTICALRRKGYTPASVRNFAEMVGVAKRDNVIDLAKLEYCVREDLNKVAERRMAVLNPLKVTITNYPEGKTELFTAVNNPEDEAAGTRQVPFSRVIYIERDDFMENPPKKFFRLQPGGEVRLRYAYLIKCEEVVKDAEGNPVMQPGTLKATKAIGWFIEEYGIAQVSMNITNISTTPLHVAFDEVCRKADARGVRVTGTEIVGLVPKRALVEAGKYFLRKQHRSVGISEQEIVRIAIKSMGLDDLKPFHPEEKVIEYLLEADERRKRLVDMTCLCKAFSVHSVVTPF